MKTVSSTFAPLRRLNFLRTEAVDLFVRQERQVRLASLYEELLSYKKLSEGWDGYDGLPPLEQTIDDAIRLIDHMTVALDHASLPLPKPSLGGDGELVLYWRFEKFYAEVSLLGDGKFFFYAASNRVKVYSSGEQEIPDSTNDEIKKIASVLDGLVD